MIIMSRTDSDSGQSFRGRGSHVTVAKLHHVSIGTDAQFSLPTPGRLAEGRHNDSEESCSGFRLECEPQFHGRDHVGRVEHHEQGDGLSTRNNNHKTGIGVSTVVRRPSAQQFARHCDYSDRAIAARNMNITKSESKCACLGNSTSPCWAALKSMLVQDSVRVSAPPSRHYLRYLKHTKISPTR
jgi:hypothetical protein